MWSLFSRPLNILDVHDPYHGRNQISLPDRPFSWVRERIACFSVEARIDMLTGPDAASAAGRTARRATARPGAVERMTTGGKALGSQARSVVRRARERGAGDRGGRVAAQALSEGQHRLSRGRPRRL